MEIVSLYLSVLTLNINGLNSPITGLREAEWIETRSNSMLPTTDAR